MTTEEDGDLSEKAAVKSPKRLARIAGVLYLLVGIFGGFAEGFVDPKVYVAGNAATTAGNVVANSGLVRWASSPTSWTGHSSSSWRCPSTSCSGT